MTRCDIFQSLSQKWKIVIDYGEGWGYTKDFYPQLIENRQFFGNNIFDNMQKKGSRDISHKGSKLARVKNSKEKVIILTKNFEMFLHFC